MLLDPYILDIDDTLGFFLLEERTLAGVKLTISGLSFHSNLLIERFEENVLCSIMRVDIHLSRTGGSGFANEFEYTFSVPDSVEVVQYGLSSATVWTRKNGPVFSAPRPLG